ncbi:bifunctional DNA-formamidopyrimidine glycosylase/DNA-(apurinic or apyrimidinic site) lyase [Kiloniella laminariae]|uniref:Formamidopyrimidine-DNA glycosylase n=1 Tax=Kiloniella laminariae TaxID=454162 RepID=A0ABT4LIS5_9PROT|nr:bifunctional DNA-formamidopyrimidine glycosylase/DNA-(apurinic or apyrimidinic site) lyase [Kiloniella laminariae]MCZ4280982.1 bifunctional DNA-formamidopyrimidine glycosylase/DNA-(apurinic or apyrimidinic site) lyase [Kiloniella laminariae]
MPELPEVETVMRGLRPSLEGRRFQKVIQRRDKLRFPLPENFAQRLTGRCVVKLARRAKYVLVHLDDGMVLFFHLGMSGRMTILPRVSGAEQRPVLDPHDHVIFETDEGEEIRYCDPRRFGMMDLVAEADLLQHKAFRDIGPEPLGNGFNGPILSERLKNKKNSIKAALLDQRVVAGIGNIYACEALYLSHISPERPAGSVQGSEADLLATTIKSVLTRAIEAGGSSLRDYVQATGELGYFQHSWAVYGREGEPCRQCGEGAEAPVITRVQQSGRSTFFCPGCQR